MKLPIAGDVLRRTDYSILVGMNEEHYSTERHHDNTARFYDVDVLLLEAAELSPFSQKTESMAERRSIALTPSGVKWIYWRPPRK